MKILSINPKTSEIKLIPEDLDDLWDLEKIISANDVVYSKSNRRFKSEGGNVERKSFYVGIKIEDRELDFEGKVLKLLGKIVFSSEENLAPLGGYHSILVRENQEVKIKKERLSSFILDILKKAEDRKKMPKILLVAMDDEVATFAKVGKRAEILFEIRSKKEGKRFDSKDYKLEYFSNILKKIKEINPEKIIVAGPGFEKEDFKAFLKAKGESGILEKAHFFNLSISGINGINEIIKNNYLSRVVSEIKAEEDSKVVQDVLKEIAKNGKVAYGKEEIKNLLSIGAVKEVILLDKLFREFSDILELGEKMNVKIHLIDSKSEAGKLLEGIGGVAAFLRYKV